MKVRMMMIEAMTMMGIMALGGYFLASRYPDKITKAKDCLKDTCRMIYMKLDED